VVPQGSLRRALASGKSRTGCLIGEAKGALAGTRRPDFTGGDPEIHKGLNRMYADVPNWPAEQRRWVPPPQIVELITQAMAVAGIRRPDKP